MRSPKALLAALAVAGGALAFAATPTLASAASSKPTIIIGSTNFTEQFIVASLYGDVLSHAGYKVDVRPNLGARQEVEPALAKGAIDLYPEYAGTLLLYLNPKAGSAANNIATAVPALKTILKKSGATVLNAAPALDTNVFAVTQATAKKYHLTTLSSLKPYASKLVLGGPPECTQNATCEVGLEKVYGLKFKSFVSAGESNSVSVAALKDNTAQVVEFFSSDGNIVENHFVALTDNLHLQAADYLIPVIRTSVDSAGVTKVLNKLSSKLTTTDLSQLNIDVNVNHADPATVAKQWLTKQGLI